jgi:cell division inhibitor SulA/protein ImuA
MLEENLKRTTMSLQTLLERPDLWRGAGRPTPDARCLPARHAGLSGLLEGWPRGALTEILGAPPGAGEVALLLPALAALTREGRWVAWVAPPHTPYAPALAQGGLALERLWVVRTGRDADSLWALEQLLRSGVCAAALAWIGAANFRSLRRLQLAAEQGGSWGVLYRPASAARTASPAALRLRLSVQPGELEVEVLKQRGRLGRRRARIPHVAPAV